MRLAQKLLTQDESLARFEGVAGDQLIVLQSIGLEGDVYLAADSGAGPNDDGTRGNNGLPWIDGALYLGSHPAAPSLLLPTNYEPVLPGEILEKVFRTSGVRNEKFAVLLQPPLLVPMAQARPVSRAVLSAWVARQVS